ncbi:hypothetical protein [Anatilimnocola floriformis]|uniref:hypothetical protein n=1 Tax=Anatilimnocola floriformis TaxID=2948575 RepID=UPI0020C1C038|nr:hypothetical protein [Anatilimnocola floriformis]
MHSLTEHSTGGVFKSAITKREYPFTRDRDGKSKREALAKMEAEANAVMAANNARAGRVLSKREHVNGVVDERTDRIVRSGEPDADRNHFRDYAAMTENELAHAPRYDKQRIQGRIDHFHKLADELDAKRVAAKVHEALMTSSEVQTALSRAATWVVRLETNHGIPNAWVEDARARLTALQRTGDFAKFWQENDAFEKTRNEFLQAKAAALDEKSEALAAEMTAAREALAEEVAATPEAPEGEAAQA